MRETQPSVRNCRFRVKCTQSWETLQETPEPRVRFCAACERTVHFCRSESELVAAVSAGQCVAFDPTLSDANLGVGDCPPVVGNMEINYE